MKINMSALNIKAIDEHKMTTDFRHICRWWAQEQTHEWVYMKTNVPRYKCTVSRGPFTNMV